MVINSLNEFSLFVNQQISFIEELEEQLAKASSLIEVALRYDLSELSEKTIHNYLWALSDIIENAHRASTHSLNEVFAASKFVNTTIGSQASLREVN